VQLWKLPHISIAPEAIIGGWITNTLLCTWIAIVVVLVFFFFAIRRRDLIPSGLQNFAEWMVEILLNLVESVSGKEKARRFFPIVAGFFFFIFAINLLDILPGIETIGTPHAEEVGHVLHPVVLGPIALLFGADSNQIVPWFRAPSTDLNLNLAMALVSIVITQYFGFAYLGAGAHLSKYLNFKALFTRGGMGVIDFVVGLLEIISELGRIISFAFRLFGNIFAGSVLLAVFAFLVPALANVIFLPFELFVAVIQAFVFCFLTLLFMQLATTGHGGHDEAHGKQHEEHAEVGGEEEAARGTVTAR
jgi:F-type H+-transporting ATPase subunit a